MIKFNSVCKEKRTASAYLHVTFLFLPGRPDISKSSWSRLVQQRQCSGRRRSIAGPGRPLDRPVGLRGTVRARPGDVQLAGRNRRTYSPCYFQLVLHDVKFEPATRSVQSKQHAMPAHSSRASKVHVNVLCVTSYLYFTWSLESTPFIFVNLTFILVPYLRLIYFFTSFLPLLIHHSARP